MKQQDNKTIDLFGATSALASIKRETMDAAQGDGCRCPVCDQFVKVYRRKISSAMAGGLITAMKRYGSDEHFHVNDIANLMRINVCPDFTKLKHWGLIEQCEHLTGMEGKKNSGVWKLTTKGTDFARGNFRLPKYVFLYDGKTQGKSDETASILECLGDKFDYNELMRPARLFDEKGA